MRVVFHLDPPKLYVDKVHGGVRLSIDPVEPAGAFGELNVFCRIRGEGEFRLCGTFSPYGGEFIINATNTEAPEAFVAGKVYDFYAVNVDANWPAQGDSASSEVVTLTF